MLPLLLEMPSKIEEAHFIIEIARKLGVPDTAVWEDVKRLDLAAKKIAPMREERQEIKKFDASPKTRRQVAEEEIIGILIWQEGHPTPVIDVLVNGDDTRPDRLRRRFRGKVVTGKAHRAAAVVIDA